MRMLILACVVRKLHKDPFRALRIIEKSNFFKSFFFHIYSRTKLPEQTLQTHQTADIEQADQSTLFAMSPILTDIQLVVLSTCSNISIYKLVEFNPFIPSGLLYHLFGQVHFLYKWCHPAFQHIKTLLKRGLS